MKHFLISLVALAAAIGQALASEKVDLLSETFANISGSMEATAVLDPTQLDNPDGWTFTRAYAGPQCVIIKKGGTVTTPPIAGLTGNAAFSFDVRVWEDPTGQTVPDWENMRPHALSINKGSLAVSEYDGMSSGAGTPYVMCDVDSSSRLTLTASYDVVLSYVGIYYAGNDYGGIITGDLTGFSHDSGEYYDPIDLTLTRHTGTMCYDDGSHNILVYTLDGSEPRRDSRRYDGTPIRISTTTTVRTATIFGNGYMYCDNARTYTFPTSPVVVIPDNTYELNVTTPGSLKNMLLDLDADVINGLVLKGRINGADLKYLTAGEGRTATLSYLDMSQVGFAYDDGTEYRTVVDAPEGGMGTTYVYHYFFSEENRDDSAGGTPTVEHTNCYRNNLAGAFIEHPRLQVVILPDGITELGERIFEMCRELTSVQMPQSLTAVGSLAFYYCDKLSLYDFPTTFEKIGSNAFAGVKLGNVRLEKQVEIGYGAFQNSSLRKLEILLPPDTIPDLAFAYTDLKEISIGEGLEYLGDRAFGYTHIETASLPATLREVADNVFYGCPFVEKIAPEDGIRYLGKVAYELTDRDRTAYTVKDGTVSLAPGLFAFTSASGFTLPASLEILGQEAFACTAITSTPQMPSLRRIGRQAFRDCPSLARAVIPESVEYIDGTAFDGCNALWHLTYNAIDAYCPAGVSRRKIERIVLGDKVRRLPRGLYNDNSNITEVILPQSIEVLDPFAFSNCSSLQYIRLSDNITTISEETFANCKALADIHWPAKLKTIGTSAFSTCEGLKTVSLPEGVETVEPWAFSYCRGVENLYIASTITSIGDGAFTFDNASVPVTITSTSVTPPAYDWNWHYVGPATIKVPAAGLAAYQDDPVWNGTANGKNNVIVPIEGISASEEETNTSFGTGIDDDTDLSDTVVGEVYVTLSDEDGYDAGDGAIVLNSVMDDEYVDAVGGMAPGESDIANRFNGLVIRVPAGKGTVVINCVTVGARRIGVKFGESEPQYYTRDSKGEVRADYLVAEDTFVYIYACEPDAPAQSQRHAPAADNCVRIYSVGVTPDPAGIGNFSTDASLAPIVDYFRTDGTRVLQPTAPGLYIGRRADGTATKILIR